jgi:putative NADPH-quinone reductase
MRILVLDAHPDPQSLCAALAARYAEASKVAGHDVDLLSLRELRFDPNLGFGYRQRTELEPDLLAARERINRCQHLVVVYPTWWGAMPALLKGFFDRTFLPGYAFAPRENSLLSDPLLKGRSARLIVTMDAPSIYDWWVYGASSRRAVKTATLAYSGFSPVKTTVFDRIKLRKPEELTAMLKASARLGAAAS